MKRRSSARGWHALLSSAVLVCGLVALPAAAHELILRYDLPIPFDLYLIACSAALVITFVLSGLFMRMPGGAVAIAPRLGVAREGTPLPRKALQALRIAGVACLALTLSTALFGSRDPDRNLSLTLFWQIFLLGLPYATALVGDVYALANPWKTTAEWLERGRRPRWQYPAWLGYWPAIAAYVAVVWLELFTHPRPALLAQALIAYSAITLAGAFAFGTAAWFRYGELFAVLLRVIGMLAPVRYRTDDEGRSYCVMLRRPFVGLVEQPADRMSLVVFVLFMLSSTTYDGMHQTIFWMGLYYNHLIVALQPLWGTDLLAAQQVLEKWYSLYQRAGLVLSPLFYLAIYLGILWLVKRITTAGLSLRTLALEFAFSIVPIAFVYNLAHYYTLVLTRLPLLPYLLSDPFNLGWNPFGFEPPSAEPPVLNMAAVWHIEVALILVGHVVSVYVAHRVALRIFPSRREAMLAQIPMLVLMVAYTVFGLWVISLPFALVSAPHHS